MSLNEIENLKRNSSFQNSLLVPDFQIYFSDITFADVNHYLSFYMGDNFSVKSINFNYLRKSNMNKFIFEFVMSSNENEKYLNDF